MAEQSQGQAQGQTQGQPDQGQSYQEEPPQGPLAPFQAELSDSDSVDDAISKFADAFRDASASEGAEDGSAAGKTKPQGVGERNEGAGEREGDGDGETNAAGLPKLKKPPEPSAQSWAKLHNAQKSHQAQVGEFRKREAEFAKRESELSSKLAAAKDSPFEALKLMGYDNGIEFLEAVAANKGQASPEQKRIRELEQWQRQQMEASKKREEEQAEQARLQEYQQNVDKWHKGIQNYAKSQDQWRDSLVSMADAEQAVFAKIQAHHESTGEEPALDDVMGEVAKEMEANLKSLLSEVAQNPRGKAILRDLAAKLVPEAPPRGKSQARTLSGSVRNSTPADDSELSLDDAVKQGAAWLTSQSRQGRF